MLKNIAILGSTGSIGKNLIEIVKKNKSKYKISLLSANKNYLELIKQAKHFKVKNLILTDKFVYKKIKENNKYKIFNIYNDFKSLDHIFKKKNYYTMSSISGIAGLEPTLNIIKYTNKIAIANKEAIICGWNLIKNKLRKHNCEFIPVDSEHYSIKYGINNIEPNLIKKIFITASGGPFLNKTKSEMKNIKISDALNHPNWKMGKKISIDSATMVNKVFEIIEAKNIFDIPYRKLSILIHPKSYIHSIILFNNDMIKLIAHKTSMTVPILNSIQDVNDLKNIKYTNTTLNLNILNNLCLSEVDKKKFESIRILDMMPNYSSLFNTAIVSANDELVSLYLKKKITFNMITFILLKFLKKKEILKFKNHKNFNLKDIINTDKYVRLKISNIIYKSN